MTLTNLYEIIEDEIKSVYRSRLQTQILLSLNEENKTLSQLRDITGSTSQAVIPKIRKLESSQLIEQDGHNYRLTPMGTILTSKMQECILAFGVFGKFKDFWANHHLEGIPKPLLDKVGDLIDSEIIRDTTEDSYKVLSIYFRHLKESRQIFVVSSMTSVELCNAVIERLARGIPVEVVITRDVFDKLDKEPYIDKYHEMMQFSNVKLLVTDEYIRVGLTVTEKFLSFGLYKKHGMIYDFSEEIFSFDNKALDWGKRFFQYYKDRSVLIEIPKNQEP